MATNASKPVQFDDVIDLNDPDAASKLARAIGAAPGDAIEIVTPQFTRTSDMPPPPALPANDEDWRQLPTMTLEEAKERGFGNWDGGLFLFPGEWFAHIPSWLEVECISGTASKWGDEARDDDIRFGSIAYGVRLGPPLDGEQ